MTAGSHRLAPQERRRLAALLVVMGVVAGALALALGLHGHAREQARAWPVMRDAHVVALPPLKESRKARSRPPSRPVRIDIPAIGLHAHVIRLGLNPDHTLHMPNSFSVTGWWSGGAKPGQRGPAVIAGHVDSTTGPAVFYRLPALRRGDQISIAEANRRVVRFRVQRLLSFAKAHFPTARVYGPTRHPTLRLITCSGQFDRSTGHYLDNTIVFATPA